LHVSSERNLIIQSFIHLRQAQVRNIASNSPLRASESVRRLLRQAAIHSQSLRQRVAFSNPTD
jgi:hypothetical protein